MDLNKFKTDPALEREGVWFPLDDARVRIARLNNPAMAAAYAAAIRPYRGSEPPATEAEKIMIACLADHVLVGWEGLEHDGKPFPYSRENAMTALGIKDFADFVMERAKDMENFKVAEVKSAVETVAKN